MPPRHRPERVCLFAQNVLHSAGQIGRAVVGGNDHHHEVVAAVEAVVPTDGMTELDANYLKNVFKLDESQYADCCVMATNVGTTIDEFGIFKGADATQAAALKTAVEEYLQFRLDSWMPEYLPEEFPKLQGAQLWAEGDYVMYAILSDDAKAAAGEAFTGCFAG